MSTKTTNYNLTKPDRTEFYDVNISNADMDTIDAELYNNAQAVINAQATANDAKQAVSQLANSPHYTLPTASATTLGGVKIGSGLSVTPDGTISASDGAAQFDHWETTASAGQTVFTLPQGKSYMPGTTTLEVRLAGIPQNPSTYTETNATTITLSTPLNTATNPVTDVMFKWVTNLSILAVPSNVAKIDATQTWTADQTFPNYNMSASNADTNGRYKVTTYKRTNASLYMTSTLSGTVDANGNYPTMTNVFYRIDGTTVDHTDTWTLTYDANGIKTGQSVVTS